MSSKPVFIHYMINDEEPSFSEPLEYDEITGYWKKNVTLPDYYNYSVEITWIDVQVNEPENITELDGVKTMTTAPEQEGTPWELVLIVLFLGATFVRCADARNVTGTMMMMMKKSDEPDIS